MAYDSLEDLEDLAPSSGLLVYENRWAAPVCQGMTRAPRGRRR